MDKLTENLPAIIGAAAQSYLGILALLSVALSVLAYLFFSGATEKIKVGIFTLLFVGVVGFGMAMFRSAPVPVPIPPNVVKLNPPPEVKPPAVEERKDDLGNAEKRRTLSSQHMATYELVAVRKYEKLVEMPFTRALGQFTATNSRQYKTATPNNGWMWDLHKPLVVKQGQGEAGRCEGIDRNQTTEQGVSVVARLDQIRNWKYPLGAPGYVQCSLEGTVYRKVSATEAAPPETGAITWGRDKIISLPSGTISFTLKLKTDDGRERVFSNAGSDQLFEIQRDSNSIVVRPKVAKDTAR